MILANAIFVILYLYFNWVEYSFINNNTVSTSFPYYIEYGSLSNLQTLFQEPNWTLLFFLLAIFVNLYLANKLQRSIETKQNPS
jgi:hypothetical protein